MPKASFPAELEAQVIAMREEAVKEVEHLRQQLRIPLHRMGPMIGLSQAHYSQSTSARRLAPLEILLIYRNVLRDMAAAEEARARARAWGHDQPPE